MACPHSESDGPCSLCDSLHEPHGATFIREGKPATSEEADGLDFGTQVDRYVVEDLIGRGGMGLVYTARDPDLDRRVAIKLLRSSAAPGDAASIGQARLMREAQAMAQLSHPNVMPVYDVGKFGNAVFIAMELVRGLTLDKWAKATVRPWREVLAMVMQAGRGLQAAHAAGLVHRDFKPANVLIGEDSRPRVTDFGIARSVRAPEKPADEPEPETLSTSSSTHSSLDTPLTRAGALMGSPGYMAPEQYAGLPTSAATDQFSFCVALYECLYGVRPFVGQSFAEIAQVTALGHVPPPPKGTAVPPWLHRVIEKGLSPRPEGRHASMTVLLDALSNDPIEKLKRRLALGAVVALVVALGGAAVWSQVQQRRACRGAERLLNGAWDEGWRAKGKQAFDATGKSYAAITWEHARAEMDAYAKAWAKERTEACEATRVRGEQSEGVMLARFECLDHRKEELQALAQAYATADIETVDRAYGAASRLSDLKTCAHARADRKQPPPEAREAAEQLSRELAQGRSLVSAGKLNPARERITSALQIARALQLPAQQAECELALGELESESRRYAQAEEALLRSVQRAEVAGDDRTAALALTAMVSLVGWHLERPPQGRALAAIANGKLERLGGDDRIAAALAEGVGDAEWQAGNRAVALESYRDALKRFTALLGPEGIDVARLHSSIGWVLTEQGLLTEARLELKASQATREKLLGNEHPTLVGMANELGTLAMALGEGDESIREYERALILSRKALGNDSLSTSRMALNLVVALARFDRVNETEQLLAHAREVLDKNPDAPPSHQMQWARSNVVVHAAYGRWAEAERGAREALPWVEKSLGAQHPDTGLLIHDLAEALLHQGRWRESVEQYDRYLAIGEQLASLRDPDYAFALAESAEALRHLGRSGEAIERLERAVSLLPLDHGNRRRGALARFMLAEALPKTAKLRARSLALEARGELDDEGRTVDVKRIDTWLEKK